VIIFYLFITGLIAGCIGALLGLGGGVIVIPVLTILFHLPIQIAIGVSLIGVIATSTGAAIVQVREGKSDLRLGMLLELGTTIGAVAGAVMAGYISSKALCLLYSALLAYNSYSMYHRNEASSEEDAMNSNQDMTSYELKNIPGGMFYSTLAGVLSGLLGVGGGLIKVPAMYLLMGVPLKIATATSNLMIGITAATSASVYYLNGRINPLVSVPVALGVFCGALAGSWINTRISTRMIKKIFVFVLAYISLQMAGKGLGW
jgi:uncharacterized membrane protein YfcA